MFLQTVIHDPDVLGERYARISSAGYHNSHIRYDANPTNPQMIGHSKFRKNRPRHR